MGKISLGRAGSPSIPIAPSISYSELIVPTIIEVPVEVIKEVYIETIKEVQVPVEVIREVCVEVPVEVIKEVQVPVETIKYLVKEVPVEVIKTHTVYDIESTMIEKQKVQALEKTVMKLKLTVLVTILICIAMGVYNV